MPPEAAAIWRALTAPEALAVELALQGTPAAAITLRTRLDEEQIAVAVSRHAKEERLRIGSARTLPAVPVVPVRVPKPQQSAPLRRSALAIQAPMPWPDTYAGGGGELTDRPKPEPPAVDILPAPPVPGRTPSSSTSAIEPGTDAWNELATSPKVRAWAIGDGWAVPGATRLPGAIVRAYIAVNGDTP